MGSSTGPSLTSRILKRLSHLHLSFLACFCEPSPCQLLGPLFSCLQLPGSRFSPEIRKSFPSQVRPLPRLLFALRQKPCCVFWAPSLLSFLESTSCTRKSSCLSHKPLLSRLCTFVCMTSSAENDRGRTYGSLPVPRLGGIHSHLLWTSCCPALSRSLEECMHFCPASPQHGVGRQNCLPNYCRLNYPNPNYPHPNPQNLGMCYLPR